MTDRFTQGVNTPRFRCLLAIVMLSIIACGCARHEETDSAPAAVVDVKTAPVRSGSIDEALVVSGSTQYRVKAQVRSPFAGLIEHFKLYNGDRVKRGETIAQIRTKESQASINGAQQLLNSAGNPAQREEARKALDLALNTANSVNIASPGDGILSDKSKNEQEVVAEGDAIGTIVDPASLYFLAQVPTASIVRVKVGQAVSMKFTARPGKSYAGKVHAVQPEVTPGDQSIPVQVTFTNPTEDLAGSLFGDASIAVGTHSNILLVPKAALLKDDENNTTSVMIVGSDSLAHKIEVKLGLGNDSEAEVSSPLLSRASLVITEGQYGLPDSTKVRIVR